ELDGLVELGLRELREDLHRFGERIILGEISGLDGAVVTFAVLFWHVGLLAVRTSVKTPAVSWLVSNESWEVRLRVETRSRRIGLSTQSPQRRTFQSTTSMPMLRAVPVMILIPA